MTNEAAIDCPGSMEAESTTSRKRRKQRKKKLKGKINRVENGNECKEEEKPSSLMEVDCKVSRKRKKQRKKRSSEVIQLQSENECKEEGKSPSLMEVDCATSGKQRKNRKKRRKGRIMQLESEFEEKGNPPSVPGDSTGVKQAKYVVRVCRPDDVAKTREHLPIVMMEQEIMEAILENPILIICGETGCGKTTQVPQFLYEAGYGSANCPERAGIIGVTQPRRVAVLATARRVAHELSVQLGQEVGFQVRHDRKIGEKSCIKFMTDGILLRELQADFLLRKYSVVVLDEAHERSLNTDILIGMLSRIIPLRQKLYDQDCEVQSKLNLKDGLKVTRTLNGVQPLKLVIMSATLRVEDFTANPRMFPTSPPLLRVPARQFPVTIHFSRKTELLDYVGAAYKKVCAIHRKLPPGGVLVFLTGQREVEDLCRKLRRSFRQIRSATGSSFSQIKTNGSERDPDSENRSSEEKFGDLTMDRIADAVDGKESILGQEGNGSIFPDEEADLSEQEFVGDTSESEDESDLDMVDNLVNEEDALQKLRRSVDGLSEKPERGELEHVPTSAKSAEGDSSNHIKTHKQNIRQELEVDTRKEPNPLLVLPLYALLPAAAQLQVFAGVPKGMRLIVVATNVAETSITIPGIRYVVDCGRAKEREIDRSSGISKYEVRWISKASADQRAGRAGRTGPGHCYRLYSSAHFNDSFPKFALPEINKSTIEGVVLVMKCMGIDKVSNFPFPSPPEHSAVVAAEKCLKSLSALSPQTGLLTPVGQAMAIYPISPRHSRMLLAAIRGAEELDPTTEGSDAGLTLAYSIAVAACLSLEDPFLREASTVEDDDITVHKRPRIVQPEMDCTKSEKVVNMEEDEQWAKQEKVKRRLRRNKANAAHAKFKNVTSDAISIANALRAYEQAEDQETFCQFHFLHAKTMHEMSKLRKQIWDLVVSNCSNASSKLAGVNEEHNPPIDRNFLSECEACWRTSAEKKLNANQEDVIRQAICAGWADKVARRLSVEEIASLPEMWHQKKVVAYRSCSSEEPAFLHPSSSVSKEAPEFVVYNELVNTSRTYMRGVSGVDAKWLVRQAAALCIFSKHLADPPPWYDSRKDEVMCWVTPSFGPHLWKLPLHAIPMKKGKHRSAVFCNSLLQGKVLPSLASLRPYLTNDPSILLKPEAQALKRVSDLMYRLGSTVDTRSRLRSAWATDPSFLYSEILSWVQSIHQTKVKEIWEQLLQEAQFTGEQLHGKRKP